MKRHALCLCEELSPSVVQIPVSLVPSVATCSHTPRALAQLLVTSKIQQTHSVYSIIPAGDSYRHHYGRRSLLDPSLLFRQHSEKAAGIERCQLLCSSKFSIIELTRKKDILAAPFWCTCKNNSYQSIHFLNFDSLNILSVLCPLGSLTILLFKYILFL